MITERAVVPMVGFLIMEKTVKEDGYITALMITDNRGYPLEFKATTPVRPSLVQKTLYGDKLEHYISVELCGKQLVKQSGRKPKIILVPDKKLLDIADMLEDKRLYRFAEQLRGAGMSMSNNIAEGSGSNSNKEFANFLNIARRSTFENTNILILLQRRNLIDQATLNSLLEDLDHLCRKITNFQKSLK